MINIMKAHLIAETLLYNILVDSLNFPEMLDLDRLSFVIKVQLAAASALIDRGCIEPLLKLNRLRNKFAHRFGYEMTAQEKKELTATLPEWALESLIEQSSRKFTAETLPIEDVLSMIVALVEAHRQANRDTMKRLIKPAAQFLREHVKKTSVRKTRAPSKSRAPKEK
jgi:hypothetical protein